MHTALRDIVTEIRSLEPFPAVASRVLQIGMGPEVLPNDLIALIQVDPGLTGKILKLCNSAYYGFQREIGSLMEAGNLLGGQTLVSLVMTSATSRYFREMGGADDGSNSHLWNMSVTTALASRLIARLHGGVDEERAYTAGLLQNIGHLVLDRFLDREQDRILEKIDEGFSVLGAEKSVLGLNHAEIGARLATRWDLPEVLVDTIRFHHSPQHAKIDPMLCFTAHLAESLAWSVNTREGISKVPPQVSITALNATGLDEGCFHGMDVKLREELAKAKAFLGG
ncbi:MAG: HD-like signal output (HDOD) protein [Planctomycetota bacterium]|jgi:HD-like signal output (HDOD) protein